MLFRASESARLSKSLRLKHINAEDAIVESAMANIDAEYKALCAEFSPVYA